MDKVEPCCAAPYRINVISRFVQMMKAGKTRTRSVHRQAQRLAIQRVIFLAFVGFAIALLPTWFCLALAEQTNKDSAETESSHSPTDSDERTLGYWRTNNGPLILTVYQGQVVGQYLEGSLTGRVGARQWIIGQWIELEGPDSCPSGTYSGNFQLEPDGIDRFSGARIGCDEVSSSTKPWDGVLISGQAWFKPKDTIDLPLRRPELDVRADEASDLMQGTFSEFGSAPSVVVHELDMTCDGGLDTVYFWNATDSQLDTRITVVHRQRPLYAGEDTLTAETTQLMSSDVLNPDKCKISGIESLQISAVDSAYVRALIRSKAAPTCTNVVLGGQKECVLYWDLERNSFGIE